MATFQPTILRFDSTDSTNLEAIRQAEAGAPEGLCIVAREQTRGRGRLDRSWQSPKDAGLYVSILLRPKFVIDRWPIIPLMAPLAASDALLRSCGVRIDIKWPNDMMLDDRKLGGILVETFGSQYGPAAVVGIGINLMKIDLLAETAGRATSVEAATGIVFDGEALLHELLVAFGKWYEVLNSSNGGEHTIREWCANSSYAYGRRVRVSEINGTFEGITRGLEGDGALRVGTADGKLRIVRAGDVTAVRSTD